MTISATIPTNKRFSFSPPGGSPAEIEAHTNIPTFSVTDETDCILDGHVNGIPTKILIDTGAAATVLAKEVWEKASPYGSKLLNTVGKKLVGIQGIPLQLHGTTTVQVNLQNEVFSTKVIVADQIATDLILGRDFLTAHQCIIEMGKSSDVLRYKERGVAITIDGKKDSNLNIHVNVVLDSPLQVALHSEIEVMGRVPDSTNERTWIVEGQVKRSPVLVA